MSEHDSDTAQHDPEGSIFLIEKSLSIDYYYAEFMRLRRNPYELLADARRDCPVGFPRLLDRLSFAILQNRSFPELACMLEPRLPSESDEEYEIREELAFIQLQVELADIIDSFKT